jgi:hypothetical protein
LSESRFKTVKDYTDVLKDVVILVPAIHLTLCFIYLYLYFAAFGTSLALFTSPTDVFSVSFLNIAPFYAGLVAQPIIMQIPVWHLEATEDRTKVKPLGAVGKTLFALPVVLGLIVGTAYYSVAGFFPTYNAILVIIMGMWWFAWSHLRIKRSWRTPVLITLFIAIALLSFNAIKDGQRDRYYALDQFKAAPRCGNVIVLRTLGDRFLALDNSGQRIIVDSTCKTEFVIGPSRPDFFPDNDWSELLRRTRRSLNL